MKILLLEDNERLCRVIKSALEKEGYTVDVFMDGEEALEVLNHGYHCFILDINVPSLDGISILETLRIYHKDIPAIIMSSNHELEKIQASYEIGCVDYLKKPFHLKELGLRIDKIKKEYAIKTLQHVILSQKYVFSKEEQMLFYNNTVQVLTKKQLQILTLLSENIGIIVDFEKFRSFVWNDEPIDNATIRAEISRFRKLLKEDFIINLKGVGYKIEKYYPQKNSKL